MQSFLRKYQKATIGVVNGFDRLLFRGTIRLIASVSGMMSYLYRKNILLKDFGQWAEHLSAEVVSASKQVAVDAGRPIEYIRSSSIDKEDYARSIAARDGIKNGLICLFTAVEPCQSFDIHKNREAKKLELVSRQRKCLWIYHYMIHPIFGFMHARIQTWLPLTVKLCINGREWLSRQLDNENIGYIRRANCFADIQDIPRAQKLFDEQLKSNWPQLLGSIQQSINPLHTELFNDFPLYYYWSADESEWATDIMFKSHEQLARLYPHLLRYGMTVFQSKDVMRFLGHASPECKKVNAHFKGQVVTDIKHRPEGVRIKHRVNNNSIKMYDKEGSVLRVETTINNTREFKVYRRANDDPKKPYRWQKMRKGVADLQRRAQVSQASNQRYLEALAAVDVTETIEEQLKPICQKVQSNGRSFRALNPWLEHDALLLETICRGEYAINGFRNRDIVATLYPKAGTADHVERKRLTAKVSRDLRLLRAHGLISKVSKTHRYVLTDKGRKITASFLLVNEARIKDLYKNAA